MGGVEERSEMQPAEQPVGDNGSFPRLEHASVLIGYARDQVEKEGIFKLPAAAQIYFNKALPRIEGHVRGAIKCRATWARKMEIRELEKPSMITEGVSSLAADE